MRVFAETERRARIAQRHHLAPGHRDSDLLTVTDDLVCLHGTDPATIYLSAWARVDSLERADVDQALYVDRSLVKHLAMRRTLFVLRSEHFGMIQSAASGRVAAQERARLIKEVERAGLVGDGAAWLDQACDATLGLLDERGEATSTELRTALELLQSTIVYAPDKPYGGTASVAPRVLTVLSASGHVIRANNRGSWYTSRPTWERTAAWLRTEPDQPQEREARAELVRRWLWSFGPATVTDVRWWLGSTLTAVRAALADLGAVEVDLHGRPGVALADDLDAVPAVEPYAALLPALDPTSMGWVERDWYLGDYKPQLVDSTGNIGPTAWWDGRMVGGWRQSGGGDVVVQLLEDVGQEGRAALDERADELTTWLAGVRVTPRFPSPMWRAAAD